MKKAGVGLFALLIAAAVMFGCEFILGPDEAVGGGTLVIGFGEKAGAGRAAAPAGLARYDLVLTGPGDQKIEAVVAAGEGYSVQAALGEWRIDAEAYNAENALIGTGSATVTVKAGRNEALVSMRVLPSPDAPEPDAPPDDAVIAVSGVSLNKSAATIFEGGTGTLTATVAPSNATNQNVTWTSSNTAVATVNAGLVKGVAAGTAIITVTTEDGNFTADCTVTVTPSPPAGTSSTQSISGISVPFRYVPAGSFMLRQDESISSPPDLTMTISQGYWMSETEVTQELFEEVMGTNPSDFDGTTGKEPESGEIQNQRPVEMVSWYDAIAFCNKLSLSAGKEPVYSVSGITDWADLVYSAIPTSDDATWDAAIMDMSKNGYRLPTEMEWMWAAMGADKTSQPNTTGYTKAFAGSDGSNSIGSYAWYYDNTSSKTHEVGKKAANELGLKDMSGNVFERCWDWYDSYPSGEQTDYTGASSGTYRVVRGGGYSASYATMRLALRISDTPSNRDFNWGFRLVRPQF